MQTHNQSYKHKNQQTNSPYQYSNQTSSDKGSLRHKVTAICCHIFRVSKIKVIKCNLIPSGLQTRVKRDCTTIIMKLTIKLVLYQ
jgi:hypothetical protein